MVQDQEVLMVQDLTIRRGQNLQKQPGCPGCGGISFMLWPRWLYCHHNCSRQTLWLSFFFIAMIVSSKCYFCYFASEHAVIEVFLFNYAWKKFPSCKINDSKIIIMVEKWIMCEMWFELALWVYHIIKIYV